MPFFAVVLSPAIRFQLTSITNAIRTIDDYARKSRCSCLMVDATLDYILAYLCDYSGLFVHQSFIS